MSVVQCGKESGTADKDTKAPTKAAEKKDAATDAVPVQVVKVTSGNISSFLLFSSNIDSEKVVDIYPMITGIIEQINVDEGQHVNKGDILAVLDDREVTINEQKSSLNYQKLKSEFERQKEIYEQQMISKDDYERLQFNMDTAKLDWEQNKLLLSYTRITSPISGVVTRRYIKVGNKINITQIAFSVVEDREKIAAVNIPEQEIDTMILKQRAVIFSGSQEVPGYIKRISPAIDPSSGTFKVTVEVQDRDGVFTVGQFVNVKIIKDVHEQALLLTKDALIYEGGKVFVFVIDDKNVAMQKEIRIGFEEGNQVEVVEGITREERIVTAGKSSLKNKTLVRVIESVI